MGEKVETGIEQQGTGAEKSAEVAEFTSYLATSNMIGEKLKEIIEKGKSPDLITAINHLGNDLPKGFVFLPTGFGPLFAIEKKADSEFSVTLEDGSTFTGESLSDILTKRGFFDESAGGVKAEMETIEKRDKFPAFFESLDSFCGSVLWAFNKLSPAERNSKVSTLYSDLNNLKNECDVIYLGTVDPNFISKMEIASAAILSKFTTDEETKKLLELRQGKLLVEAEVAYNTMKPAESTDNPTETQAASEASTKTAAKPKTAADAPKGQSDQANPSSLDTKAKNFMGGWMKKFGKALASLLNSLKMWPGAGWASDTLNKLREGGYKDTDKFKEITINKRKLAETVEDSNKTKREPSYPTALYISEVLGLNLQAPADQSVNLGLKLFRGLESTGRYVASRNFDQKLPIGSVLFFGDSENKSQEVKRTAIVSKSGKLGEATIRFIKDGKLIETQMGGHSQYGLTDLICALYNPSDLKAEEDASKGQAAPEGQDALKGQDSGK